MLGCATRSLLTVLTFWVLSTALWGQDRAKAEIPSREGPVVIEADRIFKESADVWVGEGNVIVTFADAILKSPRLSYDQQTQIVTAAEELELTRGVQWLKGSSGEFNLSDRTGLIRDAEGFTDQQLFVTAKTLIKTGPDTYVAQDGTLTACEDAIPKWSFRISKANIQVDSRATVKNTVFRVKRVPVFYLPYLVLPTGKKERSSGFLLPSIGNSNNKGRRVSESFYLVLGRSADLQVREDYFSERGFGHGFTFRTRPNNYTFLNLDGYTISDRRDQGGSSFTGTGETRFGNGYRLVADFDLVSNFVFRRVFSDSFYTATQPTEDSRLFVTNNFRNKSFNFLLSRGETIFPRNNAVTRHSPSFSFRVSGQRLPGTPFYFDLDTAAEALARSDSQLETPSISQRLDLHPSVYLSIPLFQGLRLTPRLSVRETFYSDSVATDQEGRRSVASRNLNRNYFDFTLDLKGWGLSNIYGRGGKRPWKHLIEPELTYRYTSGIDHFDQIIRFDENDAIADTHEIEYALVNRFFFKQRTTDGDTVYEWLSFKIGQKYFLDPDFGGAFRLGAANQFFPLNTLTGFIYGTTRRQFSPLTLVTRVNPSRRVSFDIRGDYDLDFNRFRNFSITGFLSRRMLHLGTTYFLTQEIEAGTVENNQLQGQVIYGNLNRGFSAATVFSYDARTKALLNSRSRVNYFWDCCGVSLEFERFNVGLRQEREIRFSFFLKGIGSFGTIRRPDSIF